jgi:hypothetical protein
MSDDVNTIGVTPENQEFLRALVEAGLFGDQMDAAKLGLSLAIRSGVGTGTTVGAATTWNVGSFDRDGHIRGVLSALFPEVQAPYRLAEHLINQGLRILRTHLAQNPYLHIPTLQQSIPSV